MDTIYAETVRLLLSAAPAVFANDIFAMKGGTAINLFVQDMPRLSVDIDVVYLPLSTTRDEALRAIANELAAIAQRLKRLGLRCRKINSQDQNEARLIVENENLQVKIEVNVVFRGTVLPIERRALCAATADMFSVELALPMLAHDELYGSKLVAAMDRQHPRDLFDLWRLYETSGLRLGIIECFVTYLAGHNRPIHEVLFSNEKDIAIEYRNNFIGMTNGEPASLDALLETRTQFRADILGMLTDKQKRFLIGLAHAKPEWDLLQCPHANALPALQWKLLNLQQFRKSRPAEFKRQADELELKLG